MGGRGGKGGPGLVTPKNGPNAPGAPTPGGSPGGGGGGGGGGQKSPGTTSPGGVTNPQGGGKGGGGGPTSTPAPTPKKWYDTVPRHGKTFKTDDDYKRDAILVNPRWNEPMVGKPDPKNGNDNDYKNNCTRTSAAWILRTYFGWDVTAGQAPWRHKTTKQPQQPGGMDWYTDDILNKWIDPATGQKRAETKVPQKVADPTAVNGERYMTNEEWIAKVNEMILADHPEGSGGFMRITGHIFNWQILNGKVRFIEPQPQPVDPTALTADPTEFYYPGHEEYTKWDKDFTKYPGTGEWWRSAKPEDPNNWFMRVDDLEPQKNLYDHKWIQTLTKVEKNAPFFEDMVLMSYSLYPSSVNDRAAFRKGWDQVRRGRLPRIPTGWKDSPIEAAYRAGVAYAKEPT